MARTSTAAIELRAAAKECVGLLFVIGVAAIKLMKALASLMLAALVLAGAAAAAAAAAFGRRASTRPPQPIGQQRPASASQLATEAVDDAAVPESPLSPPPTPVDLVAAAAAAAAAKPSAAAVVERLDPDRPRLLNRVPSVTHRAMRGPEVITPSTVLLGTPPQPATPVTAGARLPPELSPAAASPEQPAPAAALRMRGKALSFS